MCGICGFIDPDTSRATLLARMTDRLRHRGPDEEGHHQSGPVYLGHRRLSIIDRAGSRQPIFNEDRSLALVYNGEIYNFQPLRTELLARGHHFATEGDTEVLLHAYEEYGWEMLGKIAGMFAFALWDETRQSLFMARDHLGVKPLHYYWDGRVFVFASELKAVLEHPAVSRQVNLEALGLYLQSQFIPAPLTAFRDVHKLPAGHALTLIDGRLTVERFWTPDYRHKMVIGEDEAVLLLDEALRQSVRDMLISEVPLGAFISGGIDSGLIAAIMTDVSGRQVETFNLGFKDARQTMSEHREAEAVARHIGARHHTLMIDSADVIENIGGWIDVFDEPFADSAALPTMMLSKLTRDYVTVVLTGEGADEVFSGYGNYWRRERDEKWTDLLYRLGPLRYLLAALPPRLRKDRLLFAATQPRNRRYVTIPNIIHEALGPIFFSPAFRRLARASTADWSARYFDESNSDHYLDRIMHVDLRLWLPDDLLTKVDRATMAYSLEARVPYLDHRFVETASRLDPRLKQQGTTTKYILKKLAEKYLPAEIVHRPKQGFVLPIAEWLRRELAPLCRELLDRERIRRRGLLRPEVVTAQLTRHQTGRQNNAFRLWAFMVLEMWFDRYAPDFRLPG